MSGRTAICKICESGRYMNSKSCAMLFPPSPSSSLANVMMIAAHNSKWSSPNVGDGQTGLQLSMSKLQFSKSGDSSSGSHTQENHLPRVQDRTAAYRHEGKLQKGK